MRLIDADVLSDAIDALQRYKLFDDDYAEDLIMVRDVRDAIDNTPTVKSAC